MALELISLYCFLKAHYRLVSMDFDLHNSHSCFAALHFSLAPSRSDLSRSILASESLARLLIKLKQILCSFFIKGFLNE